MNNFVKNPLYTTLILSLGAGAANAADKLEEVTIWGNLEQTSQVGKLPVNVLDTPFAMDIIVAQELRDIGAKNIQEALTYSSGVYSGRFGFDTRGDWSSVRGLGTSPYVDGLRGIFGFYNNVRPEIYTLESIEVLKGPSSVLYGQSDLGGIVNVVTKKPQAISTHQFELEYGSFERKQLAVDSTGSLDGNSHWLYRIVALKRDSDTQVDYVNDDAVVLMPAVTWQPSTSTNLTLQLIHQENDSVVSSQFLPSKGTINPAPLGPIPSNRFAGEPGWDRYDTEKDELSLMLNHSFSETWSLATNIRQTDSASITREIYTNVSEIPTDTGDIGRTIHTADRTTEVLASDTRLLGKLALGSTTHKVVVGLDYQNALWEEFNYGSSNKGGTFNVYKPVYGYVNFDVLTWADRPDNRIEQTGVYLMDHMEWNAWVLSLALRKDEARQVLLNVLPPNRVVRDSATTGRAGLMYRFDFGLSPYVSYSESFLPNLGTNGPQGGQLKPSAGEQTEAGVKYLSRSGNTSVTFAQFDIEQQNRVIDGAIPGGREQIGSTTDGWELEIEQRIAALEITASITKLDAINDATKKRLSSIAEESASIWAKYQLLDRLSAGFGVRYIGTVVGANEFPELPEVSLVDTNFTYNLEQWDFRFSIRNLVDKQYLSWCRGRDQDCGFGERRNLALSASYKFK
jgi:iron complex outermembrane recepter protein